MKHLIQAINELRLLEEKYDVSIYSKGLPYGGSALVIRDNKTKEIYYLDDLEMGRYAGKSSSQM